METFILRQQYRPQSRRLFCKFIIEPNQVFVQGGKIGIMPDTHAGAGFKKAAAF